MAQEAHTDPDNYRTALYVVSLQSRLLHTGQDYSTLCY